MTSFAGLNTALSALRYQQLGMDVASANIANVATDGYTRRRVEGETVGAPSQPALWSRYAGAGDGVRVGGVSRLADAFLDARSRLENGRQAGLDVRKAVLSRVESGIGEPGEAGVAAALAAFRAAWGDVANSPDSDAARSQLLAFAHDVADALGIQARNVTTEMAGLRLQVADDVTGSATLMRDLAEVNRTIAVARLNGSDTGMLLDNRDRIALQLSRLTGAVATPNSMGGLDVTLGGVTLVRGQETGTLQVDTSTAPAQVSGVDVDGTPYTLAPADLGGRIGATVDLVDVTLPGHLSGLDAVAEQLAAEVNARHQMGFDALGDPGGAFFAYTPGAAASTLSVVPSGTSRIAASGVGGGPNLDGSNAAALGTIDGAERAYQRLVNTFGTAVGSVTRLAANQQVLTTQVEAARDQLAGVSTDEEMLAMLAHQRAYEAAARVITVIDSVLDTLINRTGLLR